MTDNNNKSDWDTDLSGFTDYEGVITDAWAAYGEQGTNLNANFKFSTSDPDNPEWSERYGMGADWASFDGGETVENKKAARFKDNSGYGQWINAACDLIAVDDRGNKLEGVAKLKKIQEVLGASPKVMKVWVGTSWFMEAREGSFQNRETGETVKFAKNYPTKYLGRVDVTNSTPSASQPVMESQTSTTSPTTTNGSSSNPLTALTESNLNQATSFAKTLDPDQWRDKMVEIISSQGLIGTPDGDNLIVAISDNGIYEQLRN